MTAGKGAGFTAGALGAAWLAKLAAGIMRERAERSDLRPPVLLAAQPGKGLLLRDIKVMDVRRGEVLEGLSVLMRDGRFAAVLAGGDAEEAEDAVTIDGGGHYAIPGLINAHCHVLWPSVLEIRADIAAAFRRQLQRSLEDCVVHGVTTVRDMGTLPLALKRWRARVEAEELLGPQILTAGPFINAPGGYPTDYIKPVHPRLAGRGGNTNISVSSPGQVGPAVQQAVEWGACIIKTALDGRSLILGQKPLNVLPDETLKALVEEAHARGLKVAAHHRFRRGFQKALRCGVDELEHMTTDAELGEDEAESFVRGGHSIVPTFSVAWALACSRPGDPNRDFPEARELMASRAEAIRTLYPIWCEPAVYRSVRCMERRYNDPAFYGRRHLLPVSDPAVYTQAAVYGPANLDRLYRAGALIGCGNDGGVPMIFPCAMDVEMTILAYSTIMSPLDILRSATINNARIMDLEDELGSIEEGKLADLVLLAGNPLERVEHLMGVKMVFKGGKLVHRAPEVRL